MPRAKGSKTGVRHSPHPLIQIHKQKYVLTLQDFCECIFPRKSLEVERVMEAIKQGKIGYGTMQQTASDVGINQNKFNAILRRLKDLGILTERYTFSEVFQNKTTAISMLYGEYTGKTNPIHQALKDANEYLKTKDYSGSFTPRFEQYREKNKD